MVNILIWQNPTNHWELGRVAICWDSVWASLYRARKSGSLWCSSLKRQVFVNYHEEIICADELFCLQLFFMNCKWFPNYRCIFVCRILTLVLSHSRVVISSTFWFNLTILIVITVFSEGDVPQLLASLIVFSLSPHLSLTLCLSSMTTWKGWMEKRSGALSSLLASGAVFRPLSRTRRSLCSIWTRAPGIWPSTTTAKRKNPSYSALWL